MDKHSLARSPIPSVHQTFPEHLLCTGPWDGSQRWAQQSLSLPRSSHRGEGERPAPPAPGIREIHAKKTQAVTPAESQGVITDVSFHDSWGWGYCFHLTGWGTEAQAP